MSQQVKALAGYQAGTSSHTMNPPFAPQEMWDPTVSMAMVTQKVQRLHLADHRPPPPTSKNHNHELTGTSCDLGTTEEPQSEERTEAPAHSDT